MWQALHEELADLGFVVVAVAMDSRPGDPLPWIEAAKPSYPTLIDRDHRLAELYGIVNVPQAVWIDEAGRIVRPPEAAGAYEGFRWMNRTTREMPEEVAGHTAQAKATYLDAIRDWARHGTQSAHALAADQARARLPALTALRAFEAAARHESFSRAATELFVTHGAVSHQIRALEQSLGTTLFERGARWLRLTPQGALLLPVRGRCPESSRGPRQATGLRPSSRTKHRPGYAFP